jgi:hypothetical protein
MLSSQADNNASEDAENDDDSYVNEAFLEDTDSMPVTPQNLQTFQMG